MAAAAAAETDAVLAAAEEAANLAQQALEAELEDADKAAEMGIGAAATGALPRYAQPNLASVLPSYANVEQDYIKDAFEPAGFTSLRACPDKLQPNAVAETIAMRQDVNRRGGANFSGVGSQLGARGSPKKKAPARTANGLFHEFNYLPSRYSLADELATQERLESEAKRLEVGGKDFLPSGQTAKLKYEDTFEDKGYRFPHMGDPFEAAEDQRLRARWLEDSKILHGPFVPSGSTKALDRPTRLLLPDMVNELHALLCEDWEDYTFSVLSTEDDNIVFRFEIASLDAAAERGLLAYMNALATTNDLIHKYELQKVVEDWSAKPGDGFLYYMFRPPWVKSRSVDAYFTLHPEQRGFTSASAKK